MKSGRILHILAAAREMILQVLAHLWQVVARLDADRLEPFMITDARELQNLRRVNRTRRQNYLASGIDDVAFAALLHLYANNPLVLDDQSTNTAKRTNVQI